MPPSPTATYPDDARTVRPGKRASARRGLGLIELLTIVALLVIVLGLMVSTARHVRSASATELTRKRMRALATAAAELIREGAQDPTMRLPDSLQVAQSANVTGVRPDTLEADLAIFAAVSNRRLGVALQVGKGSLIPGATGIPELRDAWGRPIALLPQQYPAVGLAPEDTPFLVSAGPDGQFLTLSDNIYSYDLPVLLPRIDGQPSTRPIGGATSADAARGQAQGEL